jgi:hypothetical protein
LVGPVKFEATPLLRIYADGKVLTGSSMPGIDNCTQTMTESELNQFLHFVVNKQQFYEITEAGLKSQMANSEMAVRIADAATSCFSVNLQRGTHTVNVYALMFAARQFTEIRDLQRLVEIENQSRRLVAQTNLGTGDAVTKIMKLVNQKLEQTNPGLAPFEAADVQFATRYTGGKFQATFEKTYAATENAPARTINARYLQNAKHLDPQISIRENKYGN